jgi:hypothetical protein
MATRKSRVLPLFPVVARFSNGGLSFGLPGDNQVVKHFTFLRARPVKLQ